jgi:hypothetical protein
MPENSRESNEAKRRRYIARAEEAEREAAKHEGETRDHYLSLAENWRNMAAKLSMP